MKKPRFRYFPLWALLACAFGVMALLSAFAPVSVGGYSLRDSGLSAALRPADKADAEAEESGAITAQGEAAEPEAPESVPVDTARKTILFIGDSMLEGLYPRLAAYARHNGHKLYAVIWYSSTSEVWGRSDKLRQYIDRTRPDFIFVCLGANELFVRDIESKRSVHVSKIIADIADIPYVWIGPPNWKPDTGINRLISKHAPVGSFFLSDGMHFDRSADGAHPTRRSASLWMDSVVTWMYTHGSHPILLERPSVEKASATRVFIHQPDEK